MSEDFETTLCGALDLAAAAAHTAGAEAARIRGRARATHRLIAYCALSFVLVVAGSGTAAFALSSHHGGTPHVTGGSPSTAASTAPTPGATHSAVSPPPSSNPASPSAPSSSTSPPAAHSSSPVTSADPQQVVDQAWLSAQQLPFAGTFTWTAVHADPNGVSPIGQQLSPTVFYVAKDTALQALTLCADPAQLLGRTTGAQHTEYTASGSGHTASQYIFFFADASAARAAFAWLQSQYGSCPLTAGGVQVTRTGGDAVGTAAWLSLNASGANPDLSAYNREYFVQRGSTIAYIAIESSTMLPQSYDDAAELSTITAHLCVYAGPCG